MKHISLIILITISIFANDKTFNQGFKKGFLFALSNIEKNYHTQGIDNEQIFFKKYIVYIDIEKLPREDIILYTHIISNNFQIEPISVINIKNDNTKKELLILNSYNRISNAISIKKRVNTLFKDKIVRIYENKNSTYIKSKYIYNDIFTILSEEARNKNKNKIYANTKLYQIIKKLKKEINQLKKELDFSKHNKSNNDKNYNQIKEHQNNQTYTSKLKTINIINKIDNNAKNIKIPNLVYLENKDTDELGIFYDKNFVTNTKRRYIELTKYFYHKVVSQEGTEYLQLTEIVNGYTENNKYIALNKYIKILIKQGHIVLEEIDIKEKESL